MAKQVFDLQEGKGMTAGQSTEHLRNYSVMDPDAKKYGYYDPTRVNLNFEVGKGGSCRCGSTIPSFNGSRIIFAIVA